MRRGQGFHSSVTCRSPPVISRARERGTRPRERLGPPWPSLGRNSVSCQPSPSSGGTRIASRNPPETTASTILIIFSIDPSAVSSQASQPQSGNGSVCQEPNLKCSPGKSVYATTIGAACGSCGTSFSRPATRCVPQLVHTIRKPSRFLSQYRYRFPGCSPRLAVIVGIPPAVRAVPYLIEACQHRHGMQVGGRVPAHAVEFQPDIARVRPVMAFGAECRLLAGIAQGRLIL